MSKRLVVIVGAGPYGLSLAAHLAAQKVEHRIFGYPMSFWSRIAEAGGERYLKSFCFGANISSPTRGSSFADYSFPRGLETFEPCSIRDFAAYGLWFQKKNVGWVEPVEAERVSKMLNGFEHVFERQVRGLGRPGDVFLAVSTSGRSPNVLRALEAACSRRRTLSKVVLLWRQYLQPDARIELCRL